MNASIPTVSIVADSLHFSCSGADAEASLDIQFQRTLRLPDDERDYPLPPGLGQFPLRPVERCAGRVPNAWQQRGGAVLPMYQAEAMWLNFLRCTPYPFALKIAAGKINAITGKQWREGLAKTRQNYVVIPGQPWLDGFCVAKGVVRQFVAMPLGSGYTAEEQITSKAEWGGLQIEVFPMKREAYEHMIAKRMDFCEGSSSDLPAFLRHQGMGLAPGGRMRQEIFTDPHGRDVWDTEHALRCFVHIVNSHQWQALAGEAPPHRPPTAADYTRAGLPWFEYYDENASALEGSEKLAKLTSLEKLAALKQDESVESAQSCNPTNVLHLKPTSVNQGAW